MKLKIVSDGTLDGTKILDENGVRIENAVELVWSAEVGRIPQCSVTFLATPIEFDSAIEAQPLMDKHFIFTSRLERVKRFFKKLW